MNRILSTLILLAAFCAAATAQTVENIRKDYNDTQADIKTMNDPEYPAKNRYQLTIEQMLGGSGQHKETVSIYFYEDDEEEHPGNSVRSIRFVSVSYNFAAMKYHEEYLFSKSGVLEFVFANDYFDTGDYEYRFYCNSKGVINIITKHKGNGETKFTQEYSGAMNEDYTGIFNIYKTKAENYKKLFNAIEKTTNK